MFGIIVEPIPLIRVNKKPYKNTALVESRYQEIIIIIVLYS